MAAQIIVIGLGPGRWEDITIQALEVMEQSQELYLRTAIHPTVQKLKDRWPDKPLHSFDNLYETIPSWAELYPAIAQLLCELAQEHGSVVYVVPGHPLVGEESVREVRRQAKSKAITVEIVAGLSFIEPVLAALQVDLLDGMQVVDATRLASVGSGELSQYLTPIQPALIAQCYSERLASQVKLALGDIYPDDWPVTIVRAAGVPGQEQVTPIPLYELDRRQTLDHLTCLYVPPMEILNSRRWAGTMRAIIARLRAPDGCPWDRKQTHTTLKPHLLEEAYEMLEAIDSGDTEKLTEELGDVLLQVYLHAQVAADTHEGFDLSDVYEQLAHKLVRRHPHVFGDTVAHDAEQVHRNWDAIKKQELADQGRIEESLLSTLPKAMPALAYAQVMQRRASRDGFDWPTVDETLAKVAEEIREITQAPDAKNRTEEFGDLLFALVKVAQRFEIDSEEALRNANTKFYARFQAMEQLCRDRGLSFADLSLAEKLGLWSEVKQISA